MFNVTSIDRLRRLFISTVRYGLHPLQQPLMQALSRVSVPAVMERQLVRTERMITLKRPGSYLKLTLYGW